MAREDLEVKIMKKWVVLSCTPDSAYDFFLPIVVRLWRNRIGYEPVVVLVGTEEEDWSSGHSKVVYDEIRRNERIEFLSGIPDFPSSLVSLALRYNVSAFDFDKDDILMIGDVDLFPVDRDFFHRYDSSKSPIGHHYEEVHNGRYGQRYQAFGLSMPVRSWREVVGVTIGDLRGSTERFLKESGVRDLLEAWKTDHQDTTYWNADETYVTARINNSRFSNDVAKFPSSIGGKIPCRVKLPDKPNASDYVDVHCSRPGWTKENWPDIRHLLAQMIPEDLRWVDQYVDVYRKNLEGHHF